MKAKLVTALAALLPLSVSADLVLDVRGNDPGYMTMVKPEDVNVIKTLDFTGLTSHETGKDGFSWNSVLEGMATACLESKRNPCQWDRKTPECFSNTGRIFDNPKPTLPFTAITTEFGGKQLVYPATPPSPLLNGESPIVSFSWRGCGDYGDGPWSVVFPEPYTAVCLDVRMQRGDLLTRQHFNFWAETPAGEVLMVGHHDLTGEPGEPINRDIWKSTDMRFCWVSEVPFQAITTWPEGPGAWYFGVHVGHAATDECERATRDADDATDSAEQICL